MIASQNADPFIRRLLKHPKDLVARQIFAEWLEDSGQPGHAAWANYLRTRMAARQPDRTPFPPLLKSPSENILARLTLTGRYFVRHAEHVLDLLPSRNIVLTQLDLYIPQSVLEHCPAELAHEHQVLPVLELPGHRLFVACLDPALAPDRDFFLGKGAREVHYVQAEEQELAEAILHLYGPPITPVETVLPDAAVNRLPQGDSYDGFPIERLVFLLLRDGIRWKAQDLRLESHEGGIAGVYTLSNGASQTSETLPARFTQPLLARLRQMLQIPSQGWPLAGSLCFNYAGREYLLEVQLGSDCEDSLLAEIAFPAS